MRDVQMGISVSDWLDYSAWHFVGLFIFKSHKDDIAHLCSFITESSPRCLAQLGWKQKQTASQTVENRFFQRCFTLTCPQVTQQSIGFCFLKSNEQASMMHQQCLCNFPHINYNFPNRVSFEPWMGCGKHYPCNKSGEAFWSIDMQTCDSRNMCLSVWSELRAEPLKRNT